MGTEVLSAGRTVPERQVLRPAPELGRAARGAVRGDVGRADSGNLRRFRDEIMVGLDLADTVALSESSSATSCPRLPSAVRGSGDDPDRDR
ncbi:hypothetical protein [Saccharopolyspora erythraea]|uniref:hypothetical protein n=1 Tax=Saccharopolyspora erythraea TaxID=1836 RepID=UPI00030FFCE8|nr:hypothetical protein [Saccharopolyspora erythraea]QRK92407.1 hypothetical protein JQX30_14475 [Saccharopolyspora erythraea]